MKYWLWFSLMWCVFVFSCQNDQQTFKHSIISEEKPWTSDAFDVSDQKFSFVIHGDLTGGEREGVFDEAVSKINLLRPEFIVNVGDLIEGAEKDSLAWVEQWESFDTRSAKARAPLFYAGGNHDLTGNLGQNIWKDRYGRPYYHFIYKNTLFLILDSEDHGAKGHDRMEMLRNEALAIYNDEGPEAFSKTTYARTPERKWGRIGEEQSQYFIDVIEQNPNVNWVFLLVHKPVWENLNADNFFEIEQALEKFNYSVFYGHTHVYNFSSRKGMDYINLATTGGEQFPIKGFSEDHIMWVTVDSSEVSIANLMLSGLLSKDEITKVKVDSVY